MMNLCILRDENTGEFGYKGDVDDKEVGPLFGVARVHLDRQDNVAKKEN